jgi:MATE family multidrug resistance protein
LILFSFSSVSIFFLDRLFLARYSLEALNAVTSAGTLVWTFATGAYILAAMAEVFVAQYNGAGLAHKIGHPVWQMLWFSLFSSFVFIPCAYLSDHLFNDLAYGKMAGDYFRLMMIACPLWPMVAALSAFFIGQGKTRVIVYLILATNCTTILLDWVLIFGVDGWLPPLGVKGAAWSWIFGQCIQVAFLFALFLKRENRKLHGCGQWRFQPTLFWRCLRIGLPQALLETTIYFGWAVYFWLMTQAGAAYIAIASICYSVYLLFSFIGEAVYKGIAVIAGNFIGSGRPQMIVKTLRAGTVFHALGFLLLIAFILPHPALLLNYFLPESGTLEHQALLSSGFAHIGQFNMQLQICLGLMLFYILFENISWLFLGALSAAGDTLYLFAAGSLSIWIALIAPVYYFVYLQKNPVWTAYVIMALYMAATCALYANRYYSGKWRAITLFSEGDPNHGKSAQNRAAVQATAKLCDRPAQTGRVVWGLVKPRNSKSDRSPTTNACYSQYEKEPEETLPRWQNLR